MVGRVDAEALEVELVCPGLDQDVHPILVCQDILNVVRVFFVNELVLVCLVALVLECEHVQVRLIFFEHYEAVPIDDLYTADGVVKLCFLELGAYDC